MKVFRLYTLLLALGAAQVVADAAVISVAPTTVSLTGGMSYQFSSTVTGTNILLATWSVNGVAGGNSSLGTVTSSGLYTAPSVISSDTTVTVTATTVATPQVSASASVTLVPVQVSLSPNTTTLQAGNAQQFTATVFNSRNTAVTWAISPAVGSISTSGLYTAPASITSSQTVTLTATSSADSTKKATATITLQPAATVTISLSPTTTTLQAGKTQQFTASVSGSTNTAATWSISPAVGSISTSGLYTAPASITSSQSVTVTATSSADSTKKATATITLQPAATVTISLTPTTTTLQAGKTQQFTASVSGSTNTAATWFISPAVGSVSTSGLYTAPASITSSQTVTVTATSSADSTKKATATITLQPAAAVTISLSPTTTTLQAGKTQQFTASVSGSTNTATTWSISPAVGTISTSGLYTAPASITSSQTVTVTATSSADTTKTATATVTLQPVVSISLSPTSATLQAGKTQQFTATVSGSTNTAVTWAISPAVGTISSNGLYTAPATITSAQTVTVTATSSADTTKTATATVSLQAAVTVSITLSPITASLQAGKTQQFAAAVLGSTNTAVTWALSPTVGTISTGGLYTAPSSITTAQSVTVTATSSADSTKKATATVALQATAATQQTTIGGPKIITTSLAMGYIQRAYTSVLTGSGGSTPYTWSVSSGQLPAGLSLNSSSGQLTGTPTQGGQFAVTFAVKDASGATGSSSYTLQVFEQPTDIYGGLISLPCSAGSKTHFYVQRIGSRWHFCTPAGNAFWMNGVYTVDFNDTTTDYQGISLSGTVSTKYAKGVTSEPALNWALQSVRRLKSWGFNTDNEYSAVYLWPTAVDPNWSSLSTDSTIPEKLPFTLIVNANRGAMVNSDNYANGPIKELFSGIRPGIYTGYQAATTADLVDPNYALWLKNYLANDYLVHQAITSNHSDYLVGFTVDESDQMWGFATGADFPTVANGRVDDGYEQAHLGWVILVTAPTQSGYADPKVYSKAMLSTWLASRYANNIATLNTAWGSNYTSFGSAGGWGAGSGILDEDGTCPSKKSGQTCWVTSDFIHLTGIKAGMKSDLDAFLLYFASSYFSSVKTTLNQAAPGIMYMGTLTGGWGTPARAQILQAASKYVDVLQIVQIPPNCSDCTDVQARIDFVDQYGGDKPWLQWDGYAANPDSYMSPWPDQFGGAQYPTQAARGQMYQSRMTGYLNAKGSTSGIYHAVGFEWWDYYDMRGEFLNWGLLTPRDDPYDGVSATTQAGMDAWGYPTGCVSGLGCEKTNYGDFLTAVRAANLTALRTIASGQ